MKEKLKGFIVAILLLTGLFLLMFIPAGNVAAHELYVGSSTRYNTISNAVLDSLDGTVIVVEQNTYTEQVTFGTLGGFSELAIAGNGTTIIDGTGGYCIDVIGTNVAKLYLINLTLTNDGTVEHIKATGGAVVMLINCTFNTVNVKDTSEVRVDNNIQFQVFYKDGITPIVNAHFMLEADGFLEYATSFYDPGSLNVTTDTDGFIGPFGLRAGVIDATGTTWVNNTVSVYKMEAMPHEEVLYADANTSYNKITFSKDIRAPVKIENVTVATVDQATLNVTWNATDEDPFLNYTIYQTDSLGMNGVVVGNTTDTWFAVGGLTHSTKYFYVVTVFDNVSLESPKSDVANGTTASPTTGTVQGTAKFGAITRGVGGGGADIEIIYVALLNATAHEIVNTTVNETDYNFSFSAILFQTNLTVYTEPLNDTDKGAVGVSSGWMPDQSDEFALSVSNLIQTEDMVLPWYEYVPPLPVISGKATYKNGDMDGLNATEAKVELFQHMEEFNVTLNDTVTITDLIDTETANNVTGNYTFIDVPVGRNYTVMVTPLAAHLGSVATKTDGYLPKETDWFNVTMDTTMNVELDWFEYVYAAPTIMGRVMFTGGDNDPRNASGVTVELLKHTFNTTSNATETASNGTYLVNETGTYTFTGVIGGNYSITATPATEDLYVDGTQDGYEPFEEKAIGILAGDAIEVLDINLSWKFGIVVTETYTVSGFVTFDDNVLGPKAGLFAEGADVEIVVGTGFFPGVTNADGYYEITGVPVESGYTLTVTAATADAGEMNVKDGYLAHEEPAFDISANHTINVTLVYYDYPEGPILNPVINIASPQNNEKFTVGEKITVSGNTEDIANGETVTVEIDGTEYTTTVQDGKWSVEVKLPKTQGTYFINVDAGSASNSVEITVEEDEVLSPAMIAGIIIIVAVIIIVIIVLVFMMMKKKPEEDEDEGDDGEFECPECGALVSGDTDTCPECGESFEEEDFRCPECGAQIEKDSSSCDECGTEFEGDEDDEDEDEEEVDEDEEEEDYEVEIEDAEDEEGSEE